MKLSKKYEMKGLIWKISNGNWCRKCPKCNNVIEHTGIWNKSIAARRCRDKIRCHPCAAKDRIPPSDITRKKLSDWQMGKTFSVEHRKNISKSLLGKKQTEERKNNMSKLIKEIMYRPDIRKKHLDALCQSKWLKVKTDKGQLELLEKWNRLGFNFEPNFQVKTNQDLFYIDGYDKEKNVVLEYDSKYHNIPKHSRKDLIRQQKIIDILKPKKFWRYNSETKTVKNVIGD